MKKTRKTKTKIGIWARVKNVLDNSPWSSAFTYPIAYMILTALIGAGFLSIGFENLGFFFLIIFYLYLLVEEYFFSGFHLGIMEKKLEKMLQKLFMV